MAVDALIALGKVKKVGEDEYICIEALEERERQAKNEPPPA